MPVRNAANMLSPDAQMVDLIRAVNRLQREQRFYTRLQGIRLESRMVLGERRLYAVVTDPTASNDGSEYQLAP